MKKKWLFVIIPVVALLIALSPVAAYLGIVFVNNGIANHVEKELKNYPLPEETVFMDSISIAGKLVGNGNGMQYMGSILLVSDLTEEELYEYYSQSFSYVEVRKQETQALDFIHNNRGFEPYCFELFSDPAHQDHYSITCWGSPKDVGLERFSTVLVNMDLRGH